MMKSIVSVLAALSLVACSNPSAANDVVIPPTAKPSIKPAQPRFKGPEPTIVVGNVIKIGCTKVSDGKTNLGTAFYLGEGKFGAATHVIEDAATCYEAQSLMPLIPIHTDAASDFTLLKLVMEEPYPAGGFTVNCNGYEFGRTYLTMGYALGRVLVINSLYHLGAYTDNKYIVEGLPRPGMATLEGLMIVGMSGGPIVNLAGEVVGINNVTGSYGTKAYSYELRNTVLCNGKK
jgi:S1-C subfamily serine protease